MLPKVAPETEAPQMRGTVAVRGTIATAEHAPILPCGMDPKASEDTGVSRQRAMTRKSVKEAKSEEAAFNRTGERPDDDCLTGGPVPFLP